MMADRAIPVLYYLLYCQYRVMDSATMDKPPPLLTFTKHGQFAHKTLKSRMPTTLTRAIDYIYRHLQDPDVSTGPLQAEVSQRSFSEDLLPYYNPNDLHIDR